MFTFNSSKKSMSTLILNANDLTTGTIYVKGAGEVIVKRYIHWFLVSIVQNTRYSWFVRSCQSYMTADGTVSPIDASVRSNIEKSIANMAHQALRVVAMVSTAGFGTRMSG
jgi:magnesium-transporting ATPase (P-type)